MFNEAIEDCDKALLINKEWVKAYIRKALATRELVNDPYSLDKALQTF